MKKVLIVSAHPEPQSFNAEMARHAERVLTAAGHVVRRSDLYAMEFNPVGSAADFGERGNPDYLNYAIEQRYNQASGSLAPDISAEIEKLQWADLLVLNFPLWWCSVPAILKGWIDRVLVSGLCYGGMRFYDRGGMVGKQAMLALSLGGREHMFAADGIHGEIAPLLSPIQRCTLAYVGYEVLPPFIAWHVPYITRNARQNLLAEYTAHLEGVDALTPLTFSRMADFDENLRPRTRIPVED
ncbi:MAG: NAD(P)H-dependent oxidoreductase [Sphingomonadales bacterium]|nr:NAD(P)H-dependent oxidoreductase [Sphingomonadales bacterium]